MIRHWLARAGWCAILLVMITPQRLTPSAQDTPTDTPGQTLSISALPRLDPPPTIVDFLSGFGMAAEAGVTGDFLSKPWSEIEPATGEYVLQDTFNYLSYVNNAYDYTLMIGIQVLNTTAKETPADLLDVPFDDPRMIGAFEALFDQLLPALTENVRYLSIGNEVDVYLTAHPEEWDAYKTFFDATAAYVREWAPWIEVGVTVTFDGMQTEADKVVRLTETADVAIVTYYPFKAGLQVKEPSAALIDFPQIVALADGRPVILQEVGYPSAEILGSSEAMQAEFVRYAFEAWAVEGEAIPFFNYFVLHDFTEQMCSDFETYYGFPNERFHAMLCSLGLRQADGTPKAAWDVFVEEAQRWAGP